MTYRLAKGLTALRDTLNAIAPQRSRMSDGWIGDASHASRSSDHNPHVKDGNMGVVTALDITNDPAHGVDGDLLAEALIKDGRVKYVIWNRRIYNTTVAKAWRVYKGKNPHTKHVHVSVKPKKEFYDDIKPWDAGIAEAAKEAASLPPAPAKHEHQIIQLGSQGGCVAEAQTMLNKGLKVDHDFGPKTEARTKQFQKEQKLVADGIIGPYTWEALEKVSRKLLDTMQADAEIKAALPPLEPPAAPTVPVALLSPDESVGSPRWAVQYLQGLGWPRVAAMALTANLIWESGGARDGKIVWDAHGDRGVNDGEFHSHSAAQLNDRHGRWQTFQQFATDKGKPWDDPATLLQFMDKELRSTEKNTGSRLANANDLHEAMKIALDYWRPGKPHADRRNAIADKLAEEKDG